MSDRINILKKYEALDISDQFEGYAGVEIEVGVDDDGNVKSYTAGDVTGASGRVLKFKNEFATQAMARNILASIVGFQYRPYKADKAVMDPSVELGDGVTAGDIYGGVYIKATTFGKEMISDISAPSDEEINHEYQYNDSTDRIYKKITRETSAKLAIQNDKISAKVESVGGTSTSSCSWELTTDKFIVKASGQEVLRVDENGLTVTGTIKTGTKVGGNDGFVIGTKAIYKGITGMNDSSTSGVYIGTDGIRVGSNFKVKSTGEIIASSGTFSGNVTINGGKTLQIGSTSYGSSDYGTINSGISGGNFFNSATVNNTSSYPSYFKAGTIKADNNISASGFRVGNAVWSGDYTSANGCWVPVLTVYS